MEDSISFKPPHSKLGDDIYCERYKVFNHMQNIVGNIVAKSERLQKWTFVSTVFPSYCWNLILAQKFLICVDCNFLPSKGENIIKQ